MDTLKRTDYLRHYLGAPAIANLEGKLFKGTIEAIDLEDSTVDFSYECLSDELTNDKLHRCLDPEHVEINLKKWCDLTLDDVKAIIPHIRYRNQPVTYDSLEVYVYEKNYIMGLKLTGGTAKEEEIRIAFLASWQVVMRTQLTYTFELIDNYPEILFLLCKMGFDVTGHFSTES